MSRFIYPLRLLPDGSIATSDSLVEFARCVFASVLATDRHERPLRPDYGTDKGVFESPRSPLWKSDIRAKLKIAVDNELAGVIDGYSTKFSRFDDSGFLVLEVLFSLVDGPNETRQLRFSVER